MTGRGGQRGAGSVVPPAALSGAAICVLNHYDLIGPPEAFGTAIAALAARVQAEGHPGLRGYRFYLNADAGRAQAVIDYADAAAWIGHHDQAMPWPEMRALHAVARLAEITFLGPVPPDIEAWLARSGLTARLVRGYRPVAGFQR
ncbi:MAG: hypothetical protein RIT14_142 [Pseudomonadota bacterium]|jgi:hypothetical protein